MKTTHVSAGNNCDWWRGLQSWPGTGIWWEYVDKLNTTVRMGDRRIQHFISTEGNCNQNVGNFLNNAPDLLMGSKTRRRKFLAIRKKESLMGRWVSHCIVRAWAWSRTVPGLWLDYTGHVTWILACDWSSRLMRVLGKYWMLTLWLMTRTDHQKMTPGKLSSKPFWILVKPISFRYESASTLTFTTISQVSSPWGKAKINDVNEMTETLWIMWWHKT